MFKSFYEAMNVPDVLAVVIIFAYVTAYFLHVPVDETMRSIVMIIVGFYWGSSKKDAFASKVTMPASVTGAK